jgi:pimeloyl-ACP methyl ester carboxylesterase
MNKRGTFKTTDGCALTFEVAGQGRPVLWQHGLGAPFAQPAAVFPNVDGLQRITLACRGHESSDLGEPEQLTFATFERDALTLLDHLGIERAAVGGISLGAGIALRMAAFHPTRVSRLVLARPAWVDRPSLETQWAYLAVAEIIERYGLDDGLKVVEQRPEYLALVSSSPDNAKSILSYFSRPRPETTVALLSRISSSFPGVSRADMAEITTPTLVIGNGLDVVHPLAYAETLAGLIPSARLQVITSKTVNAAAYELEFKQALANFLMEPD